MHINQEREGRLLSEIQGETRPIRKKKQPDFDALSTTGQHIAVFSSMLLQTHFAIRCDTICVSLHSDLRQIENDFSAPDLEFFANSGLRNPDFEESGPFRKPGFLKILNF
jgi:hypothetical protein